MECVVGRSYYLDGMNRSMWDLPHPIYGAPTSLAGRYLGYLAGKRKWHGFEIWVDGEEKGVLFMTEEDLTKLSVVDINDLDTDS